MSSSDGANTKLTIEIKHSLLAFIYRFFTPTVSINESSYKKTWGKHTFELPPGQYHIEVSYPWIGSSECGKNSVDLELELGKESTVIYTARLIRYLPGKIEIINK